MPAPLRLSVRPFALYPLTLYPIALCLLLTACAPVRTEQSVATQAPVSNAAPASPPANSATELSVQVLASGSQSGAAADDLSVQLATTQATLNTLWHTAYARQSALPTLPRLGEQTAVGVFLGTKPTGGYSVQVTRAQASGDTLLLTVQTLTPKPGMMTTQALTSPWVIVSVPGHYRRVEVQQLGQTQNIKGAGKSPA